MTKTILAIHITGGIAALLSMFIPLVARKGGRTHRRTGWVFVAGMTVVSITSMMLAAERFMAVPWPGARTSAVFLGYLGIFTGGGVSAGVRVLRFKQRTDVHRQLWDVTLAASIPLLGLALGIYGIAIGAPLLVAFALVGIFGGSGQLAYWLHRPGHRMHWWFAHMDLMLGSCIAATTAFVVNNWGRLGLGPSGDSLVIWLAPTAVGVPTLIIWTRHYRKQFDAIDTRKVTRGAVAAATIALLAAAAYRVDAQGLPRSRQITFSDRIAPILYTNCVSCHRPGEAAPFSLISFAEVRARGRLIAQVTKSRYMPPWHAAPGFGDFKDERRLSDAEIDDIAAWVEEGMPQGDLTRLPPLPQLASGWHLGEPDLILEMPAAFALPVTGPDMFRNFVLPTGLSEDKWVRAIEIRPSARKVVHHALFAYDVSNGSRKLDGADGRPGYAGTMAPIGLGIGGSPNVGGLGGWAVGAPAFIMPDGYAMKLPTGSDFILQTHFHLSGKPETEKTRVGLYFADKPPERRLADVPMPPLFGFGAGLSIPAGVSDYTLNDSLTLPVDVTAYALYVHAHYIAKEIKGTATLPDGTSKPLIRIRDWDFNWQDPYIYETPVLLPAGTRLDVRFVYDNSPRNPKNPSVPPRPVTWGEETFDEMASFTLLVVPVREDDRAALGRLNGERQRLSIQRGIADGTLKRMQTRRQQAPQ